MYYQWTGQSRFAYSYYNIREILRWWRVLAKCQILKFGGDQSKTHIVTVLSLFNQYSNNVTKIVYPTFVADCVHTPCLIMWKWKPIVYSRNTYGHNGTGENVRFSTDEISLPKPLQMKLCNNLNWIWTDNFTLFNLCNFRAFIWSWEHVHNMSTTIPVIAVIIHALFIPP